MNDDLLAQGNPGDMPGEARFMVLSVLAGALAGLVGSIFHLLINKAVLWPAWLAEQVDGWTLVAVAAGVTMVLTVLSVFIVRRFAPEAGGSGVQEIEGAMEGLREVR